MQGQTKSVSFDGREIKLTTGRFAPQAGGSVMIECGDTSVLVTATKSTGREGVDFLPLMCDYEEGYTQLEGYQGVSCVAKDALQREQL